MAALDPVVRTGFSVFNLGLVDCNQVRFLDLARA